MECGSVQTGPHSGPSDSVATRVIDDYEIRFEPGLRIVV